MKTAIIQTKSKAGELVFPLLAQSTHANPELCFTVLFVNENSGTIVHRASEDAAWKVGDFRQNFTPVFRTEHWRILLPTEAVTLQND
jgi:ribonuclease D